MITNLEKNFEAIKSQQFVEEYKKNNTRKEKSVYFNSKQKLWILTDKQTKKTNEFIKAYEETLPKKIKKKDTSKIEFRNKVMDMWNKGYSAKEIIEETGESRKKVYAIIWYNENKEKYNN